MEVQSAAFSFTSFRIPVFRYSDSGRKDSTSLNINFLPSGRYNKEERTFEINLEVIGIEEGTDKEILFVQCISYFMFKTSLPLAELPSYFYRNAIAIVFPYIRAFISTLTLQANSGILILGLLNLSGLEKPLQENTVEV